MAEEQKEKWLNWLALTTVILAVSATLSAFKVAGYSTRSVLNEVKASNQWNYYQAKRIRGYMFEVQKENLETDLKLKGGTLPASAEQELEKRIAMYAEKMKKWDEDRAQIGKDAKEFEKERDRSIRHGQSFGLAVVFLQMAILLSSIAALMKKKAVWAVGLAVGVVGLVYFMDGYLLFL
jgi:Flp pilus assembly protein TadB